MFVVLFQMLYHFAIQFDRKYHELYGFEKKVHDEECACETQEYYEIVHVGLFRGCRNKMPVRALAGY